MFERTRSFRAALHGLARAVTILAIAAGAGACAHRVDYDVVIRGGTVYDGSGLPGRVADIGLRADRIARIGDLSGASGSIDVDARGRAVAPGFINMLSWSGQSLMRDGRGLSEIAQGVTLQVLGEGWSLGPVPDQASAVQEALGFETPQVVTWKTLGQGLEALAEHGVSANIASFVGATTIRIHVLGFENRAATPRELQAMQALVREAMEEGAMGLSTSLIYPPAFYAPTSELIALSKAAAAHGGIYISHLRSEGNALAAALDELIQIAREAGIPAEIYHLKLAGRANWDKLDAVVQKIDGARAAGLRVTANIYTYPAASTGLIATMPPWASEGGLESLLARLADPQERRRIVAEMQAPTQDWENMLLAAGPEGILLTGFDNAVLKPLSGKTLAQVAAMRNRSAAETAAELVLEDRSRVDAIYFLMSEENVRRTLALPWVSFGSDAAAVAPEGKVLESPIHPRAYGTFARVLGKYVRDEGVISLAEAIRKLSGQPAAHLGIADRGRLVEGMFADVVVFDPATIRDHATFEDPHQLATGMEQVFVNGVRVLKDGAHTGAFPGRVVRGPGYQARDGAGARP